MIKKTIVSALALITAFSVSAAPLKKSVTWENICAHPAPLPVIGHVSHEKSSLDRPSYWSVGSETLDRDYANFDNYIQYMGETGFGYARLQSGWAKTEKKKGKYDFAWIDHQVDGLLEQGIHPWICLCYGNPLYTDKGDNLNAGIFGDGPVMDGWIKYVKEVVKRYKGKVTMFEIWNEPDGAKGADGKKGNTWKEYANLCVNTAKAIKETDPDAKVCAFGAFSIRGAYFKNGLEEIKRLGGIELLDYVTYHAYWPIPERIIPKVEGLKALCKEMNPKIQLLQGECGCPAQLEYGHALNGHEWTEYSQAKWDLRHTLVNFSMGIPSSVFTMVDLNYGWMLQSYGLLRMNLKSEPQYKRPKFHAMQNLTSIFTPEVSACDDVTEGECNTDRKIFVKGVKKNGETVGCLVWLAGDKPTSSLERTNIDIEFNGVKFKEPVYVDMLSGCVHDLSANLKYKNRGKFINLPLWDCPVLIIEKSAVKYE